MSEFKSVIGKNNGMGDAMRLNYRATYVVCFLLSVMLMITAFYLEYRLQITPCLLCLLQRIMLGILMVLFLFAALGSWSFVINIMTNASIVLFSFLGALAAGRQVWLQHMGAINPNAPTSCLPNVSFLLQHMPILDVLKLTVTETAECSHVDWSFFGLSLAKLSLFFFILFFVIGIKQFFRLR